MTTIAKVRRKGGGLVLSQLLGVLFLVILCLFALWLNLHGNNTIQIDTARTDQFVKFGASCMPESILMLMLSSDASNSRSTESNSRSAIENIAENEYFYIEEYGPLVGGGGLDIETAYLDKKGVLQKSVEHSGEILTLTEYQVQADAFFKKLASKIQEMPKEVKLRGEGPNEATSEYYPPHIIIYANLNKSGRYVWAGQKDSVPDSIQGILDALRKIKEEPEKSSQITAGSYIRGCLLDERTAEEYRKDNLFKILTEITLTKAPYIKRAVETPFYLIHVRDSDNPFAMFRKEFVPGDEIELLFQGKAFQIRSMISQGQQK